MDPAVIAAIAAPLTLLFAIFAYCYPIWQRSKWRKVLPQIIELRDMAVDTQNENWKDLSSKELLNFDNEVEILKKLLLTEIAEISESKADRYNIYGMVDTTPFRDIKDKHQRMLLGYIRRTWEIANEIIDKYS